ncbi:MAG: redoxin domain-containing protein [Candidatus Omnitrophica bacterium]|nr:redoxin domain-containing protein [Candidatus Omnitrophota bacterium]
MEAKKTAILFFLSSCFLHVLFCPPALSEQSSNISDIQRVTGDIEARYSEIRDFTADFIQHSFPKFQEIEISGKSYFKRPHKFRAQMRLQKEDDNFENNLLVFDGKIFWQQQEDGSGKILAVMKAKLDESLLWGADFLKQLDPESQFQQLKTKYNFIGLTREGTDEDAVYVLNMELKEDERERLQNITLAAGSGLPEDDLIARKALYYWKSRDGVCVKIEFFNFRNAMISDIQYANAVVNSNLADELFVFSPPQDFPVFDMTKIMDREKHRFRPQEESPYKLAAGLPDFSGTDIYGRSFDSKSLRGKIVVLFFWERSDENCVAELEMIEEVEQIYKGGSEIEIISVMRGQKNDALEFAEENGFTFKILIDEEGELSGIFDVTAFPRAYVFDKGAKFVKTYFGYDENIAELVEADIENIMFPQ